MTLSTIYILKYITTDDTESEIEDCRYFTTYRAVLKEWLINCSCEIQELDDSGIYINHVIEIAQLDDDEFIAEEKYTFEHFQQFLEEEEMDDLDEYIENLDVKLKEDTIPESVLAAFPE